LRVETGVGPIEIRGHNIKSTSELLPGQQRADRPFLERRRDRRVEPSCSVEQNVSNLRYQIFAEGLSAVSFCLLSLSPATRFSEFSTCLRSCKDARFQRFVRLS
jgi:hypothetical protein